MPKGVDYKPDLTYRTLGKAELKLDLARPAAGNGPFPAVVILNGGNWMDLGGDRKFCTQILLQLAEHGYVAVAVTHRSVTAAAFPAQIHDAKAAVRWLRGHAEKYRIDSDRIGAVGFSSGGHLALLLGSTTPEDKLEEPDANKRLSSRVQAVVSYYPPTDLALLRRRAKADKPSLWVAVATIKVLTALVPEEKDLARASPTTYARRKSAPALLIHGSADSLVPYEQSENYERQVARAGGKVTLLKLTGAEHGFGSGYGGAAGKQSDEAALAFFDKHFEKPAPRK